MLSFNELLILTGSDDYCIIQAWINIPFEAYIIKIMFGNLVETFWMEIQLCEPLFLLPFVRDWKDDSGVLLVYL